jgi:hypothetical protein
MEKQAGHSVKIKLLFILLILLAATSFNKMTIPVILSSGFGCSDYDGDWCNDDSACNTNFGGGQGDFGSEICIYPTQNIHGYYIGNESYGYYHNDIHYADSLSAGISIYYDCNGDCILDSDCDGICDFMDSEDSSNCP